MTPPCPEQVQRAAKVWGRAAKDRAAERENRVIGGDAPASLNPHFPDIEISAVVPDHADGRGSLALIKRDTCKWFSGGQLVEGERHIALASFGWFDYVTERPAPSAPPPRVDPVRVLTVGPHFVMIVMPRMEETHAYRIEYRRAGAGAFQPYAIIGAGEPTYTVAGLQPQTTYEIRVVAFNSAGEAPPSDVLVATTTNINVEEEFVSLTVLDTSETEGPIDGIGSTFAARSAVVYWDDEADGCVNAQSEVVEEPGGFLYHLRPAPQNVVPWILLNGCDYDRNNNGVANLIVYALLDATPFARTGQQFVALHLRVDTSKNLVESVSMQAGDYALETGRVMWSAAIDPIQNVQLTLPGGGVNGRLSGSVTAALLFSEPMRSGGPAGSVVDHAALVRLDFDRVVIED